MLLPGGLSCAETPHVGQGRGGGGFGAGLAAGGTDTGASLTLADTGSLDSCCSITFSRAGSFVFALADKTHPAVECRKSRVDIDSDF